MAQTIFHTITGPTRLSGDTVLFGVIDGDTMVPRAVTFDCYGVVRGNLLVADGGVVRVFGVVTGGVYDAGHTTIFGRVGRYGRVDVGTSPANAA